MNGDDAGALKKKYAADMRGALRGGCSVKNNTQPKRVDMSLKLSIVSFIKMVSSIFFP